VQIKQPAAHRIISATDRHTVKNLSLRTPSPHRPVSLTRAVATSTRQITRPNREPSDAPAWYGREEARFDT